MQYFCLILFLFPWHVSYHQESGLINSSWVVCFEFYGIEAKYVVVFTFWSRVSLDDEIWKSLAYLLRNFLRMHSKYRINRTLTAFANVLFSIWSLVSLK